MDPSKATDEDIDREIAEKRAMVAASVQKLKASITLGSVAQHVGMLGVRAAGGLGQKTLKQARKNPLPVATIAAGIGWLIAANARSENSDDSSPAPVEPSTLTEASEVHAEEGDSTLKDIVESHPFVVGALALAAGAALATAIPRSKAEDDLVASAEDLLRADKERLANMARKVRDEAAAMINEVSSELDDGLESDLSAQDSAARGKDT